MYESATLTVDTQASYGTVTGQVTGGLLTFAGVGSFAQPAAADIFSCASGPFNPAGMSGEMLAIVPRLAAAFNRSTLLIDSDQPDGENPADYYANAITNHYARIVHATTHRRPRLRLPLRRRDPRRRRQPVGPGVQRQPGRADRHGRLGALGHDHPGRTSPPLRPSASGGAMRNFLLNGRWLRLPARLGFTPSR